ncbi:MAG: hypothetical protein AUJ75_02395 [Candidatus Omnitrophica bacterium CG1_02_49_10]|nr:MAG: hypothetical protein AUJ75_02395 [Candidatus Omnitrophica bacterium CG1_02_49_10]
MEMDLQNLIDKIKKEGVQEGESQAGDIVAKARLEADDIVKAAERERANIVKAAHAEAEKLKTNAEMALKQSARDVLLGLRERVKEFFDRILKDKVSEQLSQELLKEAILKAVEVFSKGPEVDIEVVVSKADGEKLKKTLFASLAKEAQEKVILKSSPAINKGFRIGEKGKNSYLDFTDEAITEAFKSYLNPKLVDMLDLKV